MSVHREGQQVIEPKMTAPASPVEPALANTATEPKEEVHAAADANESINTDCHRRVDWRIISKEASRSRYAGRSSRTATFAGGEEIAADLLSPRLLSKAHPSLVGKAEVIMAADRWDDDHVSHTRRSARMIRQVARTHDDDQRRRSAFRASLRGIYQNRYFIPEKAAEPLVAFAASPGVSTIPRGWSMDDSIWVLRKDQSEARGFHDTEDHLRLCLENDWRLCLEGHKTRELIEKSDGADDGVQACFDVLCDRVVFIYGEPEAARQMETICPHA
jgi:hypothetical protein